jgi:ubiquinone/menaquinone biosynthesis C-methylase UbiE
MVRKKVPDNFYEVIKPRLRKRIGREIRLARHVLDLGCGSCELVKYLAGSYHQQATGVDVSSASFPRRRRSQNGERFRCIRKDASRLRFAGDECLDAVVSTWALHEMAHPEAILREARRILRPGGEILIVDFPRGSLAQKLWNENYYRPQQVSTLLTEAGFENVRVRLIEHEQIIWASGYQPAAIGE